MNLQYYELLHSPAQFVQLFHLNTLLYIFLDFVIF